MQIRCSNCGRAVTVAATGALPERCPHCQRAPVPERLGKWRIERLLAAGGMGEVYLARHAELGSRVAIKRLPPLPHQDAAAMRQRFAREALLTAAVDHPGVVRVLDFEADGDTAFLVLEYLDGRSLRSLLQAGPLPLARAVALVLGTADVLAAAHRQGVVHRDIKPENVLVGRDGGARVLDFGIARALQDDAPITRTGEILGTPEYMAPEQLLEAADAIDARTDVHALAILLYELLTGRSPFHGQNLFAVLKLVESLVPPPPSALRPEVPAAVDAVVARGLHKVAAERFADAAAFAAALRAAAPVDTAATPAPRAWPWWLALAAAAGMALGLLWPRPATTESPPAARAADPRGELRALLARGDAPEPALRSARAALADATDAEAQALRGRAALRLGAFTAALQDLDAAVQRGEATVAEAAAVAWLGANVLLPVALGAPDWLHAIDLRRRDRLFGLGSDDARALPGTPLGTALMQLARGDARAALATLRPAAGKRLAEPAATVALLAACLACADRTVIRQLLPELQADQPGPGFALLQAGLGEPAELRAALQAQRDRLEAAAADRWFAELGIAFVDVATGAPRQQRLRAAAELAWLTGGGERAVLFYTGLRLHLSAHQGFELPAAEAASLLGLLGDGDASDDPARAVAGALLHVANGDAPAAVAALRRLPDAPAEPLRWFAAWRAASNGPGARPLTVANAWAACLVGRRQPAIAAMQQLLAAPGGDVAGAQLLLALFAPDAAPDALAAQHLALATDDDLAPLQALRPLPGQPIAFELAPWCAAAAPAGTTAGQFVPLLRAYARLGHDPLPLLQLPALRPLLQPPLRQLYVGEVQGGIERR